METKSYYEQNVPQLFQIIKLSQPQSEPVMQYWKHLFASIQINRPIHPKLNKGNSMKCQYVFYKAKGPDIGMLYFQQSCLIAKKTLQIQYASIKQVTCIRVVIQNTNKTSLNPQLMLMIGYYDGKIQVYELHNKAPYDQLGKSSHALNHLCCLSTLHRQPVTDIQVYYPDKDSPNFFWMFACKDSAVSLYKKPLGNGVETLLKMKKTQTGVGKLSIFLTKNNSLNYLLRQCDDTRNVDSDQKIYIFNQMSGVSCYSLPTLKQLYIVTDSTVAISSIQIQGLGFAQRKSQLIKKLMIQAGIKDIDTSLATKQIQNYMNKRNRVIQLKKSQLQKELLRDVCILGASDDTIKFIYYQQNRVVRYSGFKNFPFTIKNAQPSYGQCKDSEVWVGCLDGSIYHFKTKINDQKTSQKQEDIRSQQRNTQGSDIKAKRKILNNYNDYSLNTYEVKYGRRIIDNGIRYLEVLGNMLIVLDVQGNIYVFDIVR